MKFVIVFLTISSLLLGAVKLFAYPSGPPNGYHGQSINCTSCHSGSAINTMSMVSISGLPEKYQPNTSYPLTLSLSGSNSRGFGFQLAVRSGNSNVGTLSTSQSGIRVDSGYLEHTTRLNSTVSFDWVSPSSSSGDVNFWVSSLATGGSSGTSGDQTYIYNKSLSENISTYSLSLTAGPGGSVSGAGIFNQGSTPSIVATPNTGYDFISWTGDGTSNSGSSTTTVSMTQNRSLTANFSLKSYTLSLSAGTGGSVSGNGSFSYNSTPSIVATPDTGYDFTGWTGDGTSNSGSSTTTVSMTQNRSLTANFSLKSYTLSLSAGTGGSVSGNGSFSYNSTPSIVATPDTGYDFTGWTGDGTSNSGSSTTTVSMTQNRSLTANFSLKSYTLSLSAGTGGSVSGNGSFSYNSTPSIVATPDTGYDFTGWTGDGTSNSGSSTTTVSMTQNRSLTANFSLKSYTLSLSAGTGGSVSGNGSFSYNSTPSIVATPDTGYDFTGWTGDGTSSSGSSTTTVSMTQDRTLTANFSLKSYTLYLSAGTGGSVSGNGSFIHGQQAIVQATAHSGFTFDSWAESGVPFDTSPSTMVLMDGDKNLTANFISQPPDTFSLTLSSSPVSAGTTKGAGSYDLNSSVSITATPNTGYQFYAWVGNGITNNEANSTTVIIDQDLNFTAKFSLKSFSLSVIAGTGGSVTGTGYFDYGTTQPIVATPALGYVFTTWLENGDALSDLNSTTILVDRDRNVTAQFSPKEFTLNLVSSGGGSVSGSGNFVFGTIASFSALPEDGYTFSNWTFNDNFFSNSSTDFMQVSSNITLTANFDMSLDPALSNAQSLGNNTYSSWLGDFIPFANGWYYHLKLGWIFPQGESSESLWFWIPNIGWFWTNQSIYGNSFLWSQADNDWVFIQAGKTVGDTLLYSYTENVWNYLDQSGI